METWNLGQIFKLDHFTVIFCSMELHSEIFSLNALFTQCSSSRASTSKHEKTKTWKLGQVFKIESLIVGQSHKRWYFSVAELKKNLWIENWRLSSQCCNLWLFWLQTLLLLIQNHDWDCSQTFQVEHRNLKLLCFWLESVQMPFSESGHQFKYAALHRTQLGTFGFVPVPYL